MNLKASLACVAVASGLGVGVAEGVTKVWDQRFGGASSEFAQSLVAAPGGGYVFSGSSYSGADGDRSQASWGHYDIWVVKITENGQKVWDRRFGGTLEDGAVDLVAAPAGGYVTAGFSVSEINGDKSQGSRGGYDYWVVKLAEDGAKTWDRRFGGSERDLGMALVAVPTGGFVVAGYSFSGLNGDRTQASRGSNDFWLVKLDELGNKIWDRRFGGSLDDLCYGLVRVPTGGYLAVGQTLSPAGGDVTQAGRGSNDYWLVKVDELGNKVWDRRFGGAEDDSARGVLALSGGGYLVVGSSRSGAGGDRTEGSRGAEDIWLLKIDENGNKIWDRRYGGTFKELSRALVEQPGQGYLVAGYSESAAEGDKSSGRQGGFDYWVMLVDTNGIKQWDRSFGALNPDFLTDALPAPGAGTFVLLGYSYSGANGDRSQDSRGEVDNWLVKFSNTVQVCDYDGDGRSDASVFNPPAGQWFIRGFQANEPVAWNEPWGWAATRSVAGDYSGDGLADLAVFDPAVGQWYIKTVNDVVLAWQDPWGWNTTRPVAGDYDGNGRWDQAVFDAQGGQWYIKSVTNTVLAWQNQWGWSTALPVPGDYNGDRRWDQAVFDPAGGLWYIKSLSGAVILWQDPWGWDTAQPVPGDYNGDGRYDQAVFDRQGGYWYIKSATGAVITWNNQWGWATAQPVAGDFNGDGRFDLAVVDTTTGRWFVKGVDGTVIAWNQEWGWGGARFPSLGD